MSVDRHNSSICEIKRSSIGLEIGLYPEIKQFPEIDDALFSDEFFYLNSKELYLLKEELYSTRTELGRISSSAKSKNILIPQADPQAIRINKANRDTAFFNIGEIWRFRLLRFLPSYPFKEHQEAGMTWLKGRESGILADDMGLGKTLQAIAALDHQLRDRKIRSALVICPKSLIGVWEAELKLWAPHLCIVSVFATVSENLWTTIGDQCHVAITNYETVRFSRPKSGTFDLVILDEIHKLKNYKSNSYKSVYDIFPNITWGLSGTPLENRPIELASILHLIDRKRVAISDGKLGSASLRTLASKYILRRNKKVISNELPNIFEKIEHIPLISEQRDAYNEIVKRSNTSRLANWIKIFGQLREICDFDPKTGRSSKIDRAIELVKAIQQLDEKVVIFSYLVRPLAELNARLEKEFRSNSYLAILTGSSSASDRIEIISKFQVCAQPSILLCTTRAMAEGVTLTSANHVIFLNEWWNPAINSQARDRVYRIGQKKDVNVYKLRTINTVESRLEEILNSKFELFSSIISKLSTDSQDDRELTPKEFNDVL